MLKILENLGAALFILAALFIALMIPYPLVQVIIDGLAASNGYVAWCGGVGLALYVMGLGYVAVRYAAKMKKNVRE